MVKKLQYLFLYTLLGLQSCSGAEEEVKFTFVRVVKWGSLLQPVIKSEEISLVKKGKLLDFVLEKIKNKKDKEKIQFISKDHNWQQIAFSGKDSKKAVRTTISKVPIMYYTEKQVKERINKA